MNQINDTNDTCRQCGKPTVALCGTGRSRWCPDCEGSKKARKRKKSRVIHGNGFDLLPFEDADIDDEETQPMIDIDDIDFIR